MQLMHKSALALAALAALGLSAARPAAAQGLDGTKVTGTLDFGFGINFFDPTAFTPSRVPAGFGNTAGTTVTVTEPQVEIGYQDAANLDTADFRNNQLILTDVTAPGFSAGFNNPQMYTFTDPAFTSASLLFTDFSGLTYSLSGDVLTINVPAGNGSATPTGGTQTAVFSINAPVPEASTTVSFGALLALGMGSLLVAAKRKKVA